MPSRTSGLLVIHTLFLLWGPHAAEMPGLLCRMDAGCLLPKMSGFAAGCLRAFSSGCRQAFIPSRYAFQPSVSIRFAFCSTVSSIS